jgi:hypothetical protein
MVGAAESAHSDRGCREPPRIESVVSQQFECRRRENMNSIIYIVGLVVIVVAILSFIGIG